jgi:group I intron endonuclease
MVSINEMGFIYMLTSPSGKSYIGQTVNTVEERFKKHRTCNSSCTALVNAVKKYSWDMFDKSWYECPNEDLNKHEEMLIEVLDTIAPNGYNLKCGGSNNSPSQETRAKISNTLKGQIISEETKQKMSVSRLGGTHSGGQKISESKKRISDEQILTGIKSGQTAKQISIQYNMTYAAIWLRIKKLSSP